VRKFFAKIHISPNPEKRITLPTPIILPGLKSRKILIIIATQGVAIYLFILTSNSHNKKLTQILGKKVEGGEVLQLGKFNLK